MSLFSSILEKLGLKKPAAPAPAPAPAAPAAHTPSAPQSFSAPKAATPVKPAAAAPAPVPAPKSHAAAAAPEVRPAAMPMVDVVSKLEGMAAANPEKLDWKISIVDLLKLLDLESGLAARKELATELGCPAEMMGGDYVQMNVWLHKTVLAKIAENGGNIPQDLLK